jgi:hypothetical protein
MSTKGRSKITIWWLAAIIAGVALIPLGPPAHAATPAAIKAAIDKGTVWLAAQQAQDGSWAAGDYDPVGTTALAVAKFADYAIESGYKTPFDSKYKYRTQVQKGLAYLFQTAVISTPGVAPQESISPKAKVLPSGTTISWSEWDQTYYTALAMMAIASSKTPDAVVNVVDPLSPDINGLTYKEVLTAALNYLVVNQNPDGGWIYGGEFGDYSDQSNTGFAGLGLGYVSKFGLTIPDSTLHGAGEAQGLQQWNNYIQCTETGPYYGGAGYTEPCYWVNGYKTGHLLYNMALVGDMIGTTPPDNALSFLENVWYSTELDVTGATALGFRLEGDVDILACYTIMKGLVAQSVTTINPPGHAGLDWFDDLSTVLMSYQQSDGHWEATTYWFSEPNLPTVLALMTLERTVAAPQFQLTFPLQGYNAYTAPVQAVLDHSVYDAAVVKAKKRHKAKVAPQFYVKDGIVKAFTGETAYVADGKNRLDIYDCCLGYCNSYHMPFMYGVLNYVGGGIGAAQKKKGKKKAAAEDYSPNAYLYFDGHAGYDYKVPSGTSVLASFDGVLRIAHTDPVNGGGYDVYKTIYIDHDNGYTSWYLYSKVDPSLLGQLQKYGYADVNTGQVIGQTAESYLHFDVRLDGIKSENIVDPYSPVLWAEGAGPSGIN